MAAPLKKRIKIEPYPTGLKMGDVFSPWEEEEEEEVEEDLHSPTDGSEDSVEVKVKPSKRKCSEPRRFGEDVKRLRPEADTSPFRPWSEPAVNLSPGDRQEEPLSLVVNHAKFRPRPAENLPPTKFRPRPPLADPQHHPHAKSQPRPHLPPGPQEVVRLRPEGNSTVTVNLNPEYSSLGRVQELDPSGKMRIFSVESLISERHETASSAPSTSTSFTEGVRARHPQVGAGQRNYKNMTRERRVEANARERTRVHTISAAFDTLRRAVPAYSHNQKLSKLSVLRIACAYILTLSRVAGQDYSADSSEPPLGDCVDHVTRTIQLEGKLRKKKDD